jgi:subtilisin family serine protease
MDRPVRPGPLAAALSLVALLVPAGHAGAPDAAAPDRSAVPASRWLVQLREPALGGRGAGPAAAEARRTVEAGQRLLSTRLGREAPRSSVLRAYTVTLNALAVRMTGAEARQVRSWPEVLAVTPDLPHRPATYATPGQIGAGEAWKGLGGQDHAGEGMKIAVIDSGVYATRDAEGRYAGNGCFDDTGYEPLPGYPRGDRRFTNNKVVVARAYFRPDAPPAAGDDGALPGPGGTGHGTHVAATAACNAGTHAQSWAGPVSISGVAPRARLLSYRVFYPTARTDDDFSDGNAYTVELVAAIEDAVRDGADVIVGSWGSSYRSTLAWPDPMVRAADGAVDAGVVTVLAVGNDGPESGTALSPALSPKVIGVGAVTRDAVLARPADGTTVPTVSPVPGDVVPAFSARGPGPDGNLKPDLVAPGVDVLSAGLGGGGHPRSLLGFGPATGTSMAAPHVAGAAAVVRQRHPAWSPSQVRSALMTTADEAVYLDDGHTYVAGVLERGAGRVDLGAAIEPGLTLEPPALGAGLLPRGAELRMGITARDAGRGNGTWDAAVTLPSGMQGTEVSVDPARIDVVDRGTAALDLRIRVGREAPPGDAEATLVLTSRGTGRRLHVPLWFSVAAEPAVDVLLLDGDGSTPGGSRPDYAARYTLLLDRLGRTHRSVDLAAEPVPSLGELRTFRMAVLFTGDRDGTDTAISRDGQNRLARWLDEGGRIWVAGQNTAEAMDVHPAAFPALGRSRLYHGFLGLAFAAPSLWEGTAPRPTLTGAGPFDGITVDLSPGAGVAAQRSIEGARPVWDTDSYAARPTTLPLFVRVSSPTGSRVPEGTAAGFGRSSEPSLEEPRREFRYRSVWTGFGIEGVNTAGGWAGPDEVARRAVDWLLEDPSVTLPPASASAGRQTVLAARAGPGLRTFRWDPGDGTPPVRTDAPSYAHTYAAPGTYVVRVEATGALGHRVVAAGSVVVGEAARP